MCFHEHLCYPYFKKSDTEKQLLIVKKTFWCTPVEEATTLPAINGPTGIMFKCEKNNEVNKCAGENSVGGHGGDRPSSLSWGYCRSDRKYRSTLGLCVCLCVWSGPHNQVKALQSGRKWPCAYTLRFKPFLYHNASNIKIRIRVKVYNRSFIII